MPKKKFQKYFSKIKIPNTQIHLPSKALSSSTGWILRSCKHTKTPSFAFDGKENEPKLSDVDRFLYENFGSLYKKEYEENTSKKGHDGSIHAEKPGGVFLDSPRILDPPPENLCSSNRFFVTPASSSSLMEEISHDTSEDTAKLSDVDRFWYENFRSSYEKKYEENMSKKGFEDNNKEKPGGVFSESPRFLEKTSEDANENQANIGPNDFITVLTYSPNPYDDFRQSMHEMIQARLENNGKIDWKFMEELLFCYLNLNEKKSYRYILSAFVDLILVLRENSI
ncbi:Transcription repressor OFP14 [Abeliophyllum distichum]|uniref:Transcription repressor n=1 Tax=Abeliophyllum distichum TaxID=126358 RepID=A0ABD1V9W2_9LAMI